MTLRDLERDLKSDKFDAWHYAIASFSGDRPRIPDVQKKVKEFKESVKEKERGEKMLKIIMKDKETGIQECFDVPKERQNDSIIKGLKPGMVVGFKSDFSTRAQVVEIVKIVKIVKIVPKPKGVVFSEYAKIPFDFKPWQEACYNIRYSKLPKRFSWVYPRGAGRSYGVADAIKFRNETMQRIKDAEAKKRAQVTKEKEAKERKIFRYRPYYKIITESVKGKDEGKDNLEKMKFPCWVTFIQNKEEKLGMLVTGFPDFKDIACLIMEYQLIDMTEQRNQNSCCTVQRNRKLKVLMDRFHIEVAKGETKVRKVGEFNV